MILDRENQYLQVKTQVAIAIADLHMLQKKKDEYQESMGEWMRKAEKSVAIQQDELARAALERYRNFRQMAQSYTEQVDDQQSQVEGLKNALQKLEQKLVQAKAKKDLLLARHRRTQVAAKANQAGAAIGVGSKAAGGWPSRCSVWLLTFADGRTNIAPDFADSAMNLCGCPTLCAFCKG